MPPRKTPPKPAEPVPDGDRDAAAALTANAVAPAGDPPGADQVEVTLPDGSVGVVDKVFADALAAARKRAKG